MRVLLAAFIFVCAFCAFLLKACAQEAPPITITLTQEEAQGITAAFALEMHVFCALNQCGATPMPAITVPRKIVAAIQAAMQAKPSPTP